LEEEKVHKNSSGDYHPNTEGNEVFDFHHEKRKISGSNSKN